MHEGLAATTTGASEGRGKGCRATPLCGWRADMRCQVDERLVKWLTWWPSIIGRAHEGNQLHRCSWLCEALRDSGTRTDHTRALCKGCCSSYVTGVRTVSSSSNTSAVQIWSSDPCTLRRTRQISIGASVSRSIRNVRRPSTIRRTCCLLP